ncbi:MAG: hypothetical protein WCW44_05735 [archaeon]|jgi:hypothetical protein
MTVQKMAELNTKEINLWVGSDKVVRFIVVTKNLTAFATIKYLIKVILSKHSEPLPLLLDTRGADSISDLSISILLSPRLRKMTLASALLVKRPTPARIIGMINKELLESKVKYPLKIFTEEEEALDWAKQYSPKNYDFSKL